MLSRLNHEIPAVYFPKDWAEGLKQILLNIYGDKCIQNEKTFEIYGFSYPSEALLIISYVGLDKFVTPISLFISCDLTDKTDSDKMMDNMFDSAGIFFDQYFSAEENNDNEFRDVEEIENLETSLFNKLKKVTSNTSQNIHLSIEEPLSLEDRIKKIETIVESYNTKFDLLFNLLKK